MKQHIKSVLALTIISSVMALLLALTNAITAPIIKENENSAVGGALKEVLPEGENFVSVDLSKYELPETVEEAYSEDNGGYVFKLKTAGYGADLILMCGINGEGPLNNQNNPSCQSPEGGKPFGRARKGRGFGGRKNYASKVVGFPTPK